METLYDWLMHNTGNAGNFYTILNFQRDQTDSLEVMARTPDFKVVNLFVHPVQTADQHPSNETVKSKLGFSDEQEVIHYLADGKTPNSQQADGESSIVVLVMEPTDEAGSVTFPPNQS
ncbi:hypothetical protein [Spirosoma sp.]|uniref:hypothetical protein n=1 Tax=Spirosoma sp. TaxID=1899569 RepID=UPI003B3A992D